MAEYFLGRIFSSSGYCPFIFRRSWGTAGDDDGYGASVPGCHDCSLLLLVGRSFSR